MEKNIIITGASRGIGLELVKKFAKKNHQILAISRNIKPLKNLGNNVHSLQMDLSKIDEFKKITVFLENWKKVDILINNAGKLINKPFYETTYQDFLEVYQINVFAVAEMIKMCFPKFKENSHVVTISSMGGIQGSVKFAGLSAYSSSKGAVITLMELLAEEYKDAKIAFNTLALGAVQTEMLSEAFPDYKAPISASEMAEYIADFSLNGNKFFNGKIIQVSSSTP